MTADQASREARVHPRVANKRAVPRSSTSTNFGWSGDFAIAAQELSASGAVANEAKNVCCAGGSGNVRKVNRVITANVPSEPMSSLCRSYPVTFLTTRAPLLEK